MKSSTAAKVVAIYSIVLGLLAFSVLISNEVLRKKPLILLLIILAVLFVLFGIIILTKLKARSYSEKGYLITLFVFYVIYLFISLIALAIPFIFFVLFLVIPYGVIFFTVFLALLIIPIVFCFTYFYAFKKEKRVLNQSELSIETKLRQLESLFFQGVISEAEYIAKRRSILDEY